MMPALPDLNNDRVRGILLDIEGTTTPIDFVYKVLFPFAREKAQDYLTRNWTSTEVQLDLSNLADEQAADLRQGLDPPALGGASVADQIESTVAYLHWLMDRDRKSTPLKSIQGKIWQNGYDSGELRSEVFEDVPPALERWRRQGKLVSIYSSGSVLAQQLLFAHTMAGDLTKYLFRYFDTTIGMKIESASYRRIADALRLAPAEIIFVSDVTAELDAARAAGLQTVLAVRPGNRPVSPSEDYPAITTFELTSDL